MGPGSIKVSWNQNEGLTYMDVLRLGMYKRFLRISKEEEEKGGLKKVKKEKVLMPSASKTHQITIYDSDTRSNLKIDSKAKLKVKSKSMSR